MMHKGFQCWHKRGKDQNEAVVQQELLYNNSNMNCWMMEVNADREKGVMLQGPQDPDLPLQ